MRKIFENRTLVLSLIIAIGAISRLIPHPFNFTPIAAMALFGGATIKDRKLAYLIPITIMFLSDLLLQVINKSGLHDQMAFVYGTTLLITWIGRKLNESSAPQIFTASLFGSVVFFITTNFGVYMMGYYGYGLSELGKCYTMAIPFFKGTLLGDLFYNTLFFGVYSLVLKKRIIPISNH